MISFYAEDIEMPNLKKTALKAWIKAVAEKHGFKLGDIAYIFCSDKRILEVNRQFLSHDYYTDIITFDLCPADIPLAEFVKENM